MKRRLTLFADCLFSPKFAWFLYGLFHSSCLLVRYVVDSRYNLIIAVLFISKITNDYYLYICISIWYLLEPHIGAKMLNRLCNIWRKLIITIFTVKKNINFALKLKEKELIQYMSSKEKELTDMFYLLTKEKVQKNWINRTFNNIKELILEKSW